MSESTDELVSHLLRRYEAACAFRDALADAPYHEYRAAAVEAEQVREAHAAAFLAAYRR